MIIEFITVALAVFIVTVILEKLIIPILQSHKVGQRILEIGPRWHKNKAGTPTMGGICFIMAILVIMSMVAIISAIKGKNDELVPLALALGLAVLNGMIGFFDDYTKLIKPQPSGSSAFSSLPLTPQKPSKDRSISFLSIPASSAAALACIEFITEKPPGTLQKTFMLSVFDFKVYFVPCSPK